MVKRTKYRKGCVARVGSWCVLVLRVGVCLVSLTRSGVARIRGKGSQRWFQPAAKWFGRVLHASYVRRTV